MEATDDMTRIKESIRKSDAVIKKGAARKGSKDRKEDSRRSFLKGSVGLVAGVAAAQLLPGRVAGQQRAANSATLENLTNAKGRPILLKDGIVLSMDRQVGDFQKADVLILGKKISAVGPNLSAPTQAVVVNATGMIVMPGFVDTHHHQFETPLRSILSDGLLGTPADTVSSYQKTILGTFAPAYLPEDARLAELVASLSQMSAGVTTTVDTSQVSLTPEHTDACIAGLKESGRRVLFAYSAGPGSKSQYPQDIVRLRKQYFSSGDQLLTLALGVEPNADRWKLARSVGAPIVSHVVNMSTLEPLATAGLMGPDNEYIHCTRSGNEALWKAIADTGGKVSIAPAIEMQMRHGMPPFLAALDHGIRPSLSVDVECNMTADMFSIMRAAFTLQRALVNERALAGEPNLPPLVTCRDVIEFATIAGATVAHLDGKIGTLTPGKEADIIMLATERINTFPLNNVPGTVVTLMDTSNVENVFVAGKVMKWQGKLVGVDLHRLQLQIEQSRDGLLARTSQSTNLFGTCCVVG
jgi:cytosine/adenosine deaminase-related metal-dependent hydrolase